MREEILHRWYLQALCYALILLAVYVTWLFLDGNSVSFVYSEF